MPCYNAESTIGSAIASMQAQSFEDWELIAWDDGSIDDTWNLLINYERCDKRIKPSHSVHFGIVRALQLATSQAQGQYLVRMDADDYALPDRLATQLTFLKENPEIALCGCRVRMTGSGIGTGRRRYASWLNSLSSHESIAQELFIECPIAHPAFAMRRTAFEAVGGYQDQGWPEDYDLIMRFWKKGWRMANVGEVLLEWRNTPDRLSMRDSRYSQEQFRRIKRHYLFQTYLKNNRTFFQWGAGEVGKKWLKEWQEPEIPVGVVDINPRKIGKRIHGIPVISPVELPAPGQCLTLVTVGAPNARLVIRDWFSQHGYTECQDYLFLA